MRKSLYGRDITQRVIVVIVLLFRVRASFRGTNGIVSRTRVFFLSNSHCFKTVFFPSPSREQSNNFRTAHVWVERALLLRAGGTRISTRAPRKRRSTRRRRFVLRERSSYFKRPVVLSYIVVSPRTTWTRGALSPSPRSVSGPFEKDPFPESDIPANDHETRTTTTTVRACRTIFRVRRRRSETSFVEPDRLSVSFVLSWDQRDTTTPQDLSVHTLEPYLLRVPADRPAYVFFLNKRFLLSASSSDRSRENRDFYSADNGAL